MISKKKGLHRNSKGFPPEIKKFKGFFRPNTGDLQKKKEKKGLHRNSKGFSGRNQKIKGFFWPNTSDPQTKKGLLRNSKGFFGRNQKLKEFFRPKSGDLQKKSSSPTLGELQNQKFPLFWSKQRQVIHNFGSPNAFGGAVFIFKAKIGLKSTKNVKNVLFCILFRQWGGSNPPLATLLVDCRQQ